MFQPNPENHGKNSPYPMRCVRQPAGRVRRLRFIYERDGDREPLSDSRALCILCVCVCVCSCAMNQCDARADLQSRRGFCPRTEGKARARARARNYKVHRRFMAVIREFITRSTREEESGGSSSSSSSGNVVVYTVEIFRAEIRPAFGTPQRNGRDVRFHEYLFGVLWGIFCEV